MSNDYIIRPRKRKSISLEMKMEILNRLEEQEKPSSIAKSYGINESTVRTIKKMEDSIRGSVSSASLESSKCSSYTRKPAIEKMEKTLLLWIEDCVQKRIPISSSTIRQKAVNIINEMREEASASDQQDFYFSGSKGWFEKFKKRYSLESFKFRDETACADRNTAKEFLQQIAKTIEENEFLPNQIFHVDEITLRWEKMPDETFVMKNIEDIDGLKVNEDCVKLLLCTNASGDYSMKPLIINPAHWLQTMKDTNINEPPARWMATKKTIGLTSDIFKDWFYKHFALEVEKYTKEKYFPYKVLLLVDNALDCLHHLEHPNIKVVYLPANTTYALQPLNRDLSSTFQIDCVKQSFNDIFNKLENNELFPITEAWDKYTILNCVKNIGLALSNVKPTSLSPCWKATWPEVVIPGNMGSPTEEGLTSNINLSKTFQESFDKLNVNDINESLVNNKLDDSELTNLIPEGSSSDEHSSELESVSFTAGNIHKALQLAAKLETAILDIDPDVQRALKFRSDLQKCCSEYQQIYTNLSKNQFEKRTSNKVDIQTGVTLPSSSNEEDSNVMEIKRKKLTDLADSTIIGNE